MSSATSSTKVLVTWQQQSHFAIHRRLRVIVVVSSTTTYKYLTHDRRLFSESSVVQSFVFILWYFYTENKCSFNSFWVNCSKPMALFITQITGYKLPLTTRTTYARLTTLNRLVHLVAPRTSFWWPWIWRLYRFYYGLILPQFCSNVYDSLESD